MAQLPTDGSIEAVYSDGYTHSETEHNDISPYTGTNNIFNDILEKRPEAEHGTMVRFSVFYKDKRYDVDWTTMPDNARPIRWNRFEQDYNGPLAGITRLVRVGFGYQYTDSSGKNIKQEMEL